MTTAVLGLTRRGTVVGRRIRSRALPLLPTAIGLSLGNGCRRSRPAADPVPNVVTTSEESPARAADRRKPAGRRLAEGRARLRYRSRRITPGSPSSLVIGSFVVVDHVDVGQLDPSAAHRSAVHDQPILLRVRDGRQASR
jgi:hypothetical protein